MYKWEVSKVNEETKYVFVECDIEAGKVGQWIPAEWVVEFARIETIRRKKDAVRKSRDYFKAERDEANDRLVRIAQSYENNERNLISELSYTKSELMLLEKDCDFWKKFALYSAALASILFFSLFLLRLVFC
jgi:hypothetical protein